MFKEVLNQAFNSPEFTIPERLHLDIGHKNISLVMPAFNHRYYGLKQIIACPDNPLARLPIIQGSYDLFDVKDGRHLTRVDASKLTAVRTAATSVFATSFFLDKVENMVIMGAGVIARHLVQAYDECYSPKNIFIWNRSLDKASALVRELENDFPVSMCTDLKAIFKTCDLVSCATHAKTPILYGADIEGPIHIDLIGSYKVDHREIDDDLIGSGDIYVDDWKALHETGDLVIPIHSGIVHESDIRGTLYQLARNEVIIGNNPITIFKSVGLALEDLAIAINIYENVINEAFEL